MNQQNIQTTSKWKIDKKTKIKINKNASHLRIFNSAEHFLIKPRSTLSLRRDTV